MSANDRWDAVIREELAQLAPEPGEWVRLVDLRPRLAFRGARRAAQDEHLKRMSRERKIFLVPESNGKALRHEDHDASIHVGDDDNHLVAWNRQGF